MNPTPSRPNHRPRGAKRKANDFAARLKKISPEAGEPKVQVQVVPKSRCM
jgi:hypothetical protein